MHHGRTASLHLEAQAVPAEGTEDHRRTVIDYYVPNGFYSETLDHYLPADFYEYLLERDLIYYYTDPTDGTKYAIGIYTRDAKRMAETGLYEGTDIDPVVAIVSYFTPRIDTAVDFIEFLFDYPNCLEAE